MHYINVCESKWLVWHTKSKRMIFLPNIKVKIRKIHLFWCPKRLPRIFWLLFHPVSLSDKLQKRCRVTWFWQTKLQTHQNEIWILQKKVSHVWKYTTNSKQPFILVNLVFILSQWYFHSRTLSKSGQDRTQEISYSNIYALGCML